MSLEERIERLERTNRRYRLMFTLLGVLAVCTVGISATQEDGVPDVIQAKAFEVVDDDGNVIVTLNEVKGTGAFVIFGKTGELLVAMGPTSANGKDAGVVSTFREGKMITWLGANPRGDGMLTTHNGQGKTLVELGVTAEGQGVVNTWNGNGTKIVNLGAASDGGGMVTTWNGNGTKLVSLGVTSGGGGNVTTWNGNGKTLVELGVTKGGGAVRTFNDQGKALVIISSTAEGDGGKIVVNNKTGEAVCTLTVDEYGNGLIGAWDRNGKGRALKPGP